MSNGTNMNNLEAALAYMARFPGVKLFPAKYEDGSHRGHIRWGAESSDDPEQIRAWAKKFPNCYFCCNYRASGVRVIDIDTKHNKDGAADLLSVELDNEDLPETLTVATPSGNGRHLHFAGECAFSIGKIGANGSGAKSGIDIPGMTPVPGSTVPGKGTYKIIKDLPIAQLPGWWVNLTGEYAPAPTGPTESRVDLDLDHNIGKAVHYLKDLAPEAIEGSNGDYTAYTVACRVRDFGISLEKASELMFDHYSPKCSPPDLGWLEEKIANAYDYAQNRVIGVAATKDSPEAAFKDFEVEEDILPPKKEKPKFTRLNRDQILSLPDMEWVIKGVLPASGISSITGQSTAGKSFLAFDMACHIGYGEEWFGRRVKARLVVYVCLEGEAGFKHRVEAWEIHHKRRIPPGLDLIKDSFRIMDPDHIDALADEIPEGAVVIVDTLNRAAPDAEENTSKDMGLIISGCAELERRTRGPVILVSHEGKDSSKSIRGHSSLFAALDGVITVKNNGDQREWTISKCKDGMSGVTYACELRVVDIRKDEDGDTITSCVIIPTEKPIKVRQKMSDTERLGLDTFHEAMPDDVMHVEVEAWRKTFYRKHTGANADAKRKAFDRVRKSMTDKKYLRCDGTYYYLLNLEDVDTTEEKGGEDDY